MKKKNTMPEKDWQQTHEKIRWRELRKRILVMGLTVAMVANTVDLSALSVSAKTDESETGKTTIVSFEELSKDITEQTLPIGALESDIKFPTSLTVTVEKTTQADEKEADDEEDASETGDTEKDDAQKDDSNGDTASSDDKKDTESSDEKDGDSGNADASDKSGASDNGNADTKDSDTSKDSGNSDKSNNPNGSSSADAAASSETETTTEKIRLENIKWELNVEESDAEEFDSSEASNGFCYAYTPVLPDEDGDGNQLVLGKDVELPTIYVLVGEYGIALLADGVKYQAIEIDKGGNEETKIGTSDTALVNYLKTLGNGNKNLKKVSIELLDDCEIKPSSIIEISSSEVEEMILDLNGKTLKISVPSSKSDKGLGLVFENGSATITSSANGGKIEGVRSTVDGYGLITVGNGSRLDIENVTIENQSTAPTVIVGLTKVSEETAICTMTNATIKGKRRGRHSSCSKWGICRMYHWKRYDYSIYGSRLSLYRIY